MGCRALQLYISRYASTALHLYTLYILHPSTPHLWPPRRDAPLPPPPEPLWDVVYDEAVRAPAAVQYRFIHRGHAGDVAALVLIEGLGGLTLYNT